MTLQCILLFSDSYRIKEQDLRCWKRTPQSTTNYIFGLLFYCFKSSLQLYLSYSCCNFQKPSNIILNSEIKEKLLVANSLNLSICVYGAFIFLRLRLSCGHLWLLYSDYFPPLAKRNVVTFFASRYFPVAQNKMANRGHRRKSGKH